MIARPEGGLRAYRREEEGSFGGFLDYRLLVSRRGCPHLITHVSGLGPPQAQDELDDLVEVGCNLLFVRAAADEVSGSAEITKSTEAIAALMADAAKRLGTSTEGLFVWGSGLSGTAALLCGLEGGATAIVDRPVVKDGAAPLRYRGRDLIEIAAESTSGADVYLFEDRPEPTLQGGAETLGRALAANDSLRTHLANEAFVPARLDELARNCEKAQVQVQVQVQADTRATDAIKACKELIKEHLGRVGVEISAGTTALDSDLGAGASEAFTALFRNSQKFGHAVDDVSFLIYPNKAAARAAYVKIAREVGEGRRTAVRQSLIAVFGPVRSHNQTNVVLESLSQLPD